MKMVPSVRWDDKRRESATADSLHEESRPNSPARRCEERILIRDVAISYSLLSGAGQRFSNPPMEDGPHEYEDGFSSVADGNDKKEISVPHSLWDRFWFLRPRWN